MISGCKRTTISSTPAACLNAERSFGSKMHRFCTKLFYLPADSARAGTSQTDFRIARRGERWILVRRNHQNFMPPLPQQRDNCVQRTHHAVDLRMPRVRNQRDLHAACPISSSTATKRAGWFCLAFRAAISSAQWRIFILPSSSSTSAVQPSTQSPSLYYSIPLIMRCSAVWIWPQSTPSTPRLSAALATSSS